MVPGPRAWKPCWSSPRIFPGATSPSPAPTTPCGATWKTRPWVATPTISPSWTAACPGPERDERDAAPGPPRLLYSAPPIHAPPPPVAQWAALSRYQNDFRRHRKLHQVQIHGLRGGLPGRLLPRGPELPDHRSGRMHRLHSVRTGMPGRGDLFGRRTARGTGALQAAQCRAGEAVAGHYG